MGDAEVLHVSRHGEGHTRLSNHVTHRANIAALEELGAECVIGVTVCGAVDPAVPLGSLVVFDDLHFLANRLADGSLCTLYDTPGDPRRGHWIYEGPFSRRCAPCCSTARAQAGVPVRDGGCYGHVDGPRFNTRAEIRAPVAGRRHRGQPDRRARRPCSAASGAPVRPARLRDRLRERGHRGGDARGGAPALIARQHGGVRRRPGRGVPARRPRAPPPGRRVPLRGVTAGPSRLVVADQRVNRRATDHWAAQDWTPGDLAVINSAIEVVELSSTRLPTSPSVEMALPNSILRCWPVAVVTISSSCTIACFITKSATTLSLATTVTVFFNDWKPTCSACSVVAPGGCSAG